MSEHWFRSWHGAPTDPKWLSVARRADVAPGVVVAVVWALFDHASQETPRGGVTHFDIESTADFLGFDDPGCVSRVVDALKDKGIIKDGMISAWEKRQPKRERPEDVSTERVRAFREKKRHETPVNVGNAMKRPEERRVEEIREEVIKTSSKKLDHSPSGERSPSISELKADFDEWYRVFPRHAGVGGARAKYLAKRKEGFSKETLLEGARAAAKYYAEEDKRYIPMPATWLNQERWSDDYTGPPPKAEQRQRGFREEVDFFEGAI
jgi:hypothetical protein